ncbi:lanthionine synthetase C family protein [Flavobacterium johnsoniae]|uniref:Lanthionine synthetase C family protein n=1 Tax=Flavobacterium johnsoniae TaxID=986 RepID=A0A1J7C441_FLAJO|nr:lanthionine synthetase C family protein [Flavobacterium johnsoniae]OIV40465.1 hypothetical protein BKM63_16380 [Flavobacterium johnsoniae]
MLEKIYPQAPEITDVLLEQMIDNIIVSIPTADHTLIHGKPGILIALSYYYKFNLNPANREKIENAIEDCLNYILLDIETKHLDPTLAFGLSGISYAFQTSYDLGQESKIDKEWFKDLNRLIAGSLEYFVNDKEYDYLRGASGIATYLLHFYPKEKHLSHYIEGLYNQAVWTDDKCCHWVFYSFNENGNTFEYLENKINLGLAHGMSGIISILAEFYRKKIAVEKCYMMIEGAVNFLKKNYNDTGISQFPGIWDQNEQFQKVSRLGWCYGDTALGLAIVKAGKYCSNDQWTSFGEKICLKSATRDANNALLDEHGICHGYFGTMHLFNRLSETLENVIYKERKEYWFTEGMLKRDFDLDSTGVYQTVIEKNGNIEKFTTTGVLQGLSGVLLCLLSYKNKFAYPWDKFLLINIEKQ